MHADPCSDSASLCADMPSEIKPQLFRISKSEKCA